MSRPRAPQASPERSAAPRASQSSTRKATKGARPAASRKAVSSPPPRTTRIIAVANQKGGVGKSTTAVSLGAALAELGSKVLVVDLDPQGNASTGLGIRHDARDVTVYDVLAAEAPIDGAIMATSIPGLSAIPSTIDLAGAEIELVSQFSRELRLKRALDPLKAEGYDYVLLDCPPSLGLLTVNALAAAAELIVPIQCEYYALEGLGQLLRNVRLVQENINPSLRLTGIVMTMFDSRTRLSEQVVAEVRRYFGERVYETVIPRTVRLSEAPGFGQPITVYDSRSRGAAAYRELAREVAARLPSEEPLPAIEELPTTIEVREPEPVAAPRPLTTADASGDLVLQGVGAEPATEDLPREVEPELTQTEPGGDVEVPEEGTAIGKLEPEEPAPEALVEVERVLSGSREEAIEVESPDLVELHAGSIAEERPIETDAIEGSREEPSGQGAPVLEVPPPDVSDESVREWITAVEAEAQPEGEPLGRRAESPPVREIDLETEPEPPPGVEPEQVVIIADRDAAGDHGPGDEAPADLEEAGWRRWRLFRRGGSR